MPQDIYPLVITTDDTTYTLQSKEDFFLLPDSIQSRNSWINAYDSVISSTEKVVPVNPSAHTGAPPFFIIGFLAFIILMAVFGKNNGDDVEESESEQEPSAPDYLFYKGEELAFSEAEVHAVCQKYNPYYGRLSAEKQQQFIQRAGAFIYSKDFYIISQQGYKEMPILIAAAAVQISFGLAEYTFPYFSRIIIHPGEYIAYDPLRILVGNVQGDAITLSWKHFLEDYSNPADGKNVGLHEMAHALQVQHLFQNYGYRNEFKEDYEHYDKIDDEVLNAEKESSNSLFDKNALSNPNEFWATSVELFFEKPQQLQSQHPRLYAGICLVLNQDTAAM